MKTNNDFANEFLKRFNKSKTIRVDDFDETTMIGWNLNLDRNLLTHNIGYSQEFTITPFGIKVLKAGGWEDYIEQVVQSEKLKKYKDDLVFKKLKADLSLVEDKLKDYKTTKSLSRISFIVAIVLAALKLIEYIK